MISQNKNNLLLLDELNQLPEILFAKSGENTPDWLRQLRQEGLSRFRQLGIPTTKDEEWKYTNISSLAGHHYSLEHKTNGHLSSSALARYLNPDDINIVFVNGILNKELFDVHKSDGIEILILEDATKIYPSKLQELWNYYQPQKDSAFVSLNKALSEQGIYIDIKNKVISGRLIHIVHVSDFSGEPVVTLPRTVIRMRHSSEAEILETHVAFNDESIYLSVPLTEIWLDENASLSYIKAQKESLKSYHIGATRVLQDRDSTFNGFSLVTGALITRNDLDVAVNASGVFTSLNGLYSVCKNQHVDNHTSVDHREPNSTSKQLYKGVLNDSSRAVFNGKIFVRSGAQQTNSYQLNKNLLLGKECQVDTKPQLEIFADDVKCTHGATIGQLSEDEIFYLQTRCMPRKLAAGLLIQGFINDILGKIQNVSVREKMEQLIFPSIDSFLTL